jgi:hypothetical protein
MPQDPITDAVSSPTSEDMATSEDIKNILGPLDDSVLLQIIDLRPTVRDLEDALIWLSGDPDVFEASKPLCGPAAEIVAILQSQEQDEERR